MGELVLYKTPNCNKCIILGNKLKERGYNFKEVIDIDFMISNGYQSAPILKLGDKIMDFREALVWIKE